MFIPKNLTRLVKRTNDVCCMPDAPPLQTGMDERWDNFAKHHNCIINNFDSDWHCATCIAQSENYDKGMQYIYERRKKQLKKINNV